MLDRFWWIWQMQDPEKRIDAWVTLGSGGKSGGASGGGHNHSKRAATPEESVIDLEWLAPSIPLIDANDQLGGNHGLFCYIYI